MSAAADVAAEIERLTVLRPTTDRVAQANAAQDDHAARELFGRARLDGFAFDVELLFLARRLGLAVNEVPVRAAQPS